MLAYSTLGAPWFSLSKPDPCIPKQILEKWNFCIQNIPEFGHASKAIQAFSLERKGKARHIRPGENDMVFNFIHLEATASLPSQLPHRTQNCI